MVQVVQAGFSRGESTCWAQPSVRECKYHPGPYCLATFSLSLKRLCRGCKRPAVEEEEQEQEPANKAAFPGSNVGIMTSINIICIMAEMEVICESGFRR